MRRKEKTENSAKPFVIDRHWVWEAYKPEFGVVKSYFVCSDKGHTIPADKMPA